KWIVAAAFCLGAIPSFAATTAKNATECPYSRYMNAMLTKNQQTELNKADQKFNNMFKVANSEQQNGHSVRSSLSFSAGAGYRQVHRKPELFFSASCSPCFFFPPIFDFTFCASS